MSVGGELLVNLPSAADQRLDAGGEAVAVFSDGSSVTAFNGRGIGDHEGVFFRRFDLQGVANGAPHLVNATTAGVQSNATVAAQPGGGFVVAWQGRGAGDRHGVFARWFEADGDPLTGEVLINQTVGGGQSRPQVGVDSTGVATFVWQGVGVGDVDGVLARRFSAAGAALGNELLVNTATAREQAFADIAVAGDNTALVTWSSRHQDGSDWGIFGQRLAADGTKVGGEFRVNTQTTGSQLAASVEALDAGFAVAWQSRGQDGDGWGVFGRQIDIPGAILAGEFQINESAAGNQRQVAIADLGGSSLLAAWTDGKPDGSGWNVLAREFRLTNGVATGEPAFAVHPATATSSFGHQTAPSVAARGNLAVIAWSGDGVYLQRFSTGVNHAPNLAAITNKMAQVGVQLQVTVTATDADAGDTLTYLLDADNSPAGATIEKLNNGQAIIRWTPLATDLPGPASFRVLVVDNGLPSLRYAEDFLVTLAPAG